VVVQTQDGRNVILKAPLSDAELKDYKDHPEAFFGKIQHVGKNITDPFEFLERLMQTHQSYTRQDLLRQMGHTPDTDPYKGLPDDEMRLLYCERLVISIFEQNEQLKRGKESKKE
jgi:hypothetical protein